jgi:hypothetical protein
MCRAVDSHATNFTHSRANINAIHTMIVGVMKGTPSAKNNIFYSALSVLGCSAHNLELSLPYESVIFLAKI